jgi:antitoxin PrlF
VKHIAKLSSKYQASIPSGVREALGLHPGDRMVFEVDADDGVTLRRYPTLDELAGSVPTPADVRGLTWSEIRERAWTQPARTAVARRTRRR